MVRARSGRTAVGALAAAAVACGNADEAARAPADPPAATEPTAVATDWEEAARERMVKEQIAARGVEDERVLAAMGAVPRHEFIPGEGREHAYEDHPVPIGHGQTISQPYIVAVMTELAAVGPNGKVLEIGTGSGYQAAVLGQVAGEVYSIEILEPLAARAKSTLERLGYDNVHVRQGDGYQGWPDEAPFDAVIVTAAPPSIPQPLKDQLKVGGRMVIPVGDRYQELRVITRASDDSFEERTVFPVRFVPMTGKAQQ